MKGVYSDYNQSYINRERVCPFLLRVFIKEGSYHNIDEFSRTKVPQKDEIQLYTWRDATLKEISNLIKESHVASRNKESVFDFSFIYPDKKGLYISKKVGTIYSNKKTDDDFLTLDQLLFNHQYIDVLLSIPHSSSSITNTTTTTTTTTTSPTLSN